AVGAELGGDVEISGQVAAVPIESVVNRGEARVGEDRVGHLATIAAKEPVLSPARWYEDWMITDAGPFADLDAYVGLPRVAGLWLSPDGSRLIVGVGTADEKKNRYTTALWEVDPEGKAPARRLTRSAEGESGAEFLPSGDFLFISARPDPEADGDEPA